VDGRVKPAMTKWKECADLPKAQRGAWQGQASPPLSQRHTIRASLAPAGIFCNEHQGLP